MRVRDHTFLYVIILTILSGCSTPEERAKARQYRIEMEQRAAERAAEKARRELELLEASFGDTCSSYGYEIGTPQFNQCVATEKRQYMAEIQAEKRARKAEAERKKLARELRERERADERRRRSECLWEDKVYSRRLGCI